MKKLNASIVGVLSLVFIAAAVDKALHFDGFLNALSNYKLTPTGWAAPLAVPIIAVEFLVGVCLVFRRTRHHAALTSALLLALFTAALMVNYAYGERGICGCWFTITVAQNNTIHILQNVFLLALALLVWLDPTMIPLQGKPDRKALLKNVGTHGHPPELV